MALGQALGWRWKQGGRLHPPRCIRRSTAGTRRRGWACFAAFPAEKPFPCVFGSLIFLNKQFLCTEEKKKKFSRCCAAKIFLGSRECGGFHLLAAPLVLHREFLESSSSEQGDGNDSSEP